MYSYPAGVFHRRIMEYCGGSEGTATAVARTAAIVVVFIFDLHARVKSSELVRDSENPVHQSTNQVTPPG
jgi:hypothetical protein